MTPTTFVGVEQVPNFFLHKFKACNEIAQEIP